MNHEIFKVMVFELSWLGSVINACKIRLTKFGSKTNHLDVVLNF